MSKDSPGGILPTTVPLCSSISISMGLEWVLPWLAVPTQGVGQVPALPSDRVQSRGPALVSRSFLPPLPAQVSGM